MNQKDLKEIHELLLENVREENEKENKEMSDSLFNATSKRNLISVAREALKPKNSKQINIKNDIATYKINKSFNRRSNKITHRNENFKNSILSDKQYLNLMMNDLKYISSSIKKKQNKFNPIYSNNYDVISKMKNKNKDNSRKIKKVKMMNIRIIDNMKKKNYNTVNLLTQIIGDKDSNDIDKYGSENTENNSYFDNLFYDNNEKKYYVKENTNNYY